MTKQQTINKCIAYLKANYEFLISSSEYFKMKILIEHLQKIKNLIKDLEKL